MSEIKGRVVLEKIKNDEIRRKIINFLLKISKNMTEEKIALLISQLPVVLVKNVSSEKAGGLVSKLKELGAEARFIPFRQPQQQDISEKDIKGKPIKDAAVAGKDIKKRFIAYSCLLICCTAIVVYLYLTKSSNQRGIYDDEIEFASEQRESIFTPEIRMRDSVNISYNVRYRLIDDYEKWAFVLYLDKNFSALENHITSILRQKEDSAMMYELYTLYSFLGEIRCDEDVSLMRQIIDNWCEQSPKSHIPWLVRGCFNLSLAWHIRGASYAKDVPQKAWAGFRKYLREAKDDLEKSWEINPSDPNSSCHLIQVSIGMSLSERKMEKYFQNAISASPYHFGAHYKKLVYLMPKWHGSSRKMLDFAEQCMALSDSEPYMGLIWATAMCEIHKHAPNKENILGRADIWQNVENIYDAFFEQYPDDIRRRFFYVYHAYKAKKYDIAFDQFEIIGDRWMEETFWLSMEHYNKSRAFTYYQIGRNLLWKDKQYEESSDYFLKSIRYNPTANAYYGLGISYWHTSYEKRDIYLLREAEAALENALALEPEHKYAKKELAKLRQMLEKADKI